MSVYQFSSAQQGTQGLVTITMRIGSPVKQQNHVGLQKPCSLPEHVVCGTLLFSAVDGESSLRGAGVPDILEFPVLQQDLCIIVVALDISFLRMWLAYAPCPAIS